MRKIYKRRTGKPIEDVYEARNLAKQVKAVWPMVQVSDHRAPHGRTSRIIAQRSDLGAIIEAHYGYIWIYIGSEYCGFEGYKALFIGLKDLPTDFETRFHDYVVIGE